MPVYEYLCAKCGQFETMQRITDAPLKRCPTCRGTVKKLISNTSFQLKGSGWYATDYGQKGNGAKESSASSGDGAAQKSTEASTSESGGSGKKSEKKSTDAKAA